MKTALDVYQEKENLTVSFRTPISEGGVDTAIDLIKILDPVKNPLNNEILPQQSTSQNRESPENDEIPPGTDFVNWLQSGAMHIDERDSNTEFVDLINEDRGRHFASDEQVLESLAHSNLVGESTWGEHSATASYLHDINHDEPYIIQEADDIAIRRGLTCAICIREYRVGDYIALLPCGHALHYGCDLDNEPGAKSSVQQAMQSGICFICRQPINKNITSDQYLRGELASEEAGVSGVNNGLFNKTLVNSVMNINTPSTLEEIPWDEFTPAPESLTMSVVSPREIPPINGWELGGIDGNQDSYITPTLSNNGQHSTAEMVGKQSNLERGFRPDCMFTDSQCRWERRKKNTCWYNHADKRMHPAPQYSKTIARRNKVHNANNLKKKMSMFSEKNKACLQERWYGVCRKRLYRKGCIFIHSLTY